MAVIYLVRGIRHYWQTGKEWGYDALSCSIEIAFGLLWGDVYRAGKKGR